MLVAHGPGFVIVSEKGLRLYSWVLVTSMPGLPNYKSWTGRVIGLDGLVAWVVPDFGVEVNISGLESGAYCGEICVHRYRVHPLPLTIEAE